MKLQTRSGCFGKDAELANTIKEWIEAQDTAVTVRRVFYAMVTDKVLDNTMAEYKHVSRVVTNLRRFGMLDWLWISDTTRNSHKSQSHLDVTECVLSAVDRFRVYRWADQEYHVEVWVEKRGHISALFPTTNALDVQICDKGGRCLFTEDQAQGLLEAQADGKKNFIIYVGDYDASGLRMDIDNKRQLAEWGVVTEWQRVALTLGQVQEHKLPPAFTVPARASQAWIDKHPDVEILGKNADGQSLVNKLEKDPNAQWFRDRHHGDLFQVEVDALPVEILRESVRDAIMAKLDLDLYNLMVEDENEQRDDERQRILVS